MHSVLGSAFHSQCKLFELFRATSAFRTSNRDGHIALLFDIRHCQSRTIDFFVCFVIPKAEWCAEAPYTRELMRTIVDQTVAAHNADSFLALRDALMTALCTAQSMFGCNGWRRRSKTD